MSASPSPASLPVEQSPAAPKPWMLWVGRVFAFVVVAMLGFSASMKLTLSPQVLEGMQKGGFSSSTIIGIGVAEVVSAVLFAIPQTAVLGAILVTGYLGGATETHVRQGDSFVFPVLLGVLAWGSLFLRDPRLRALLPLRKLR
ncbi:DoxX family protein [Myxococcus sp. K15C18031901]|uniref:DoxX family protein n=1 Tax=Myxococcus dinghuensis TaxID=2906761 RepID=UPI0020A6F739|nr:DoxX family protein [Myxococcus dinghuensis]MCP3103569.1 DoxX family protein [Myxococcus dinghuensis]